MIMNQKAGVSIKEQVHIQFLIIVKSIKTKGSNTANATLDSFFHILKDVLCSNILTAE